MLAKALLLSAFAAFAAAQSTVLTFTRVPNPVTDGEAAAITYATNDTDAPVTIILRKGPSGNLKTVDVLTTNANGGQFVWTPPPSLANGADYALEIRQKNQINYFGPLTVQGAIPASVSASASASSANATKSRGTAASHGTGTTMSRNTTMSKATLTNTKHHAKTTSTSVMTSTSKVVSSKTASQSPANTGGATSDFAASSSFALVFGALAAVFYLY